MAERQKDDGHPWECDLLSGEKVADDLRDGVEGCADLRLILAAGFGDVRFAASGTADELCYSADELAGLDALDEVWSNACDDGDFAFRLGAGENDDGFPRFLLQVVDKRAELAALKLIGAMAQDLDAFDFDG